jgi:uncharacterized protein YjiS (DUF1127 family)
MPHSPAALTALDVLGFGPVASPFARFRAARAAARAAARSREATRQSYRTLIEAGDHLLKDVGLTRDEVRRALQALDGR